MVEQVWECKIVIDAPNLPGGFDYPPRMAVIKAVEEAGFPVLACFSGWGGVLTEAEKSVVEMQALRRRG